MAFRLKEKTKETIKSDSDLFAAVSKALNIKPYSLPGALATNNKRLIEYQIIKIIAKYTGLKPDDLMDEYDDTDIKTGQEIVSK